MVTVPAMEVLRPAACRASFLCFRVGTFAADNKGGRVTSTICVTGGSGFIGGHLVDLLVRQGHRVRMLSRSARPPKEGVTVVRGDLLSDVPTAFLEGADVIYHCAGEIADPSRMRPLHAGGTERLLGSAVAEVQASGRPLHWVQLSSVGAYGPLAECRRRECVVTEEWPEVPVGEYEVTKTLSDRLVRDCSAREPRITATILRPSNVFGPGMPNNSVRSLLKAMHKGWFFAIGRHEAIATYVHVDDVARALLLCGTLTQARGGTWILSNDCEFREIVAALAAAEKRRASSFRVPETLVRAAARAARVFVRHPLSEERIDAMTRRVRYDSSGLLALGLPPLRDVPQAMVEFWRLDGRRP